MPKDMRYSITCWFDRAIAFRPDDAQVRVLWTQELIRSKQTKRALEQVKIAEELARGNPTLHYNVALLYFDLQQYERSMANARIAYDQGFNLPGLRDKLAKAGHWKQ
jgi:tetratricopeptide (TPR) repeat protein